MKRQRETDLGASARTVGGRNGVGPRLLDVSKLLRERSSALAALEDSLARVSSASVMPRVGVRTSDGIEAARAALAEAEGPSPSPSPALTVVRLPQHLRRRTASHRRRDLPRRLRLSVKTTENLHADAAARCRAHRRKPSLLRFAFAEERCRALALAAGSQPGKVLDASEPAAVFRLPATHVWHAKRFHFGDVYGVPEKRGLVVPVAGSAAAMLPQFRLPLMRTDRGPKAAQRSAITEAVVHDASYTCILRVEAAGGGSGEAALASILALLVDADDFRALSGLMGFGAPKATCDDEAAAPGMPPGVVVPVAAHESRAKAARRRRADARRRASAPAALHSAWADAGATAAVRSLLRGADGGVLAPVMFMRVPTSTAGASRASLLVCVPPMAVGGACAALRVACSSASLSEPGACVRASLVTDLCLFSLAGTRCHSALTRALAGGGAAALPPSHRTPPMAGLPPDSRAALLGRATAHEWQANCAADSGDAASNDSVAAAAALPPLLAQGGAATAPLPEIELWRRCCTVQTAAAIAALPSLPLAGSGQPWQSLLPLPSAVCSSCRPLSSSPACESTPPLAAPKKMHAAADDDVIMLAPSGGLGGDEEGNPGPAKRQCKADNNKPDAAAAAATGFPFIVITHNATLCQSLHGAKRRAAASRNSPADESRVESDAPHRIDVIVPVAAARALWLALAAGAHGGRCAAVGSEEWAGLQLALWPTAAAAASGESLFPDDFPDAPDAARADAARGVAALASTLRRTAAQRPDWAVLGSAAPLAPLWSLLWPCGGGSGGGSLELPALRQAAPLLVFRRRAKAIAALDAAAAAAAPRAATGEISGMCTALPTYLPLPADAPPRPHALLPMTAVPLARGAPARGWALSVPRHDDLARLRVALASILGAASGGGSDDAAVTAAAGDASETPSTSTAVATVASAARLLERLPPLAPVSEPPHAGCVIWEAAAAGAVSSDVAVADANTGLDDAAGANADMKAENPAVVLDRFHRATLHVGMLLGARAAGSAAITSRQLAGYVTSGVISHFAGAAPRACGHVRLDVVAAMQRLAPEMASTSSAALSLVHADCLSLLARIASSHTAGDATRGVPQARVALARRLAWLCDEDASGDFPSRCMLALTRSPNSADYVWVLLAPRLHD